MVLLRGRRRDKATLDAGTRPTDQCAAGNVSDDCVSVMRRQRPGRWIVVQLMQNGEGRIAV